MAPAASRSRRHQVKRSPDSSIHVLPEAIRGSPLPGCDGTAPATACLWAARRGSCQQDIALRRPSRTVPPPSGPQGLRACTPRPTPLFHLFCHPVPQGRARRQTAWAQVHQAFLAAGLIAITGFQKHHIRGAHRDIVHACNEALLEKRGSFVACQPTSHGAEVHASDAPTCTSATLPPETPRLVLLQYNMPRRN